MPSSSLPARPRMCVPLGVKMTDPSHRFTNSTKAFEFAAKETAIQSSASSSFGKATVYFELLPEVIRVATRHKYRFLPDEVFREWQRSEDYTVAARNRVVALELVDKAHLSAVAALLRTRRWADAVVTAHGQPNVRNLGGGFLQYGQPNLRAVVNRETLDQGREQHGALAKLVDNSGFRYHAEPLQRCCRLSRPARQGEDRMAGHPRSACTRGYS